jgi:hypothetical protein
MLRPTLAVVLLGAALLAACGGGTAVVDGTITVPQDAIASLTSFAFRTRLDVNAADGDFHLTFEGEFEAPDRVHGTLTVEGENSLAQAAASFYGGADDTEAVVIGERAWWRPPGGDWRAGIEPGDSLDPLVTLRQYATPSFYLEALRFDDLLLPVSSGPEEVDGERVYIVALDKQGVIDVMAQGTEIKLYPDGERDYNPVFPGVRANAQQVLPANFSVEVWLTDQGRPTRIIFDYDVTEEDYSNLAFGFQHPLHLRLDMDITDADADVMIEPPIPIPTETPAPTPPPAGAVPMLSDADQARIREIAFNDARLQQLLSGRAYEFGEVFVWHAANLELLGGGFVITLREPAEIEYAWPLADESNPPYETTTSRFRARGIERLTVLVHLGRQELVEIQPEGAEMEVEVATPP